jgi:hypothetical protein
MYHAKEIARITTGNAEIDKKLVQIGRKLDNHEFFNYNDFLFVDLLLRKMLRCEQCRLVLRSLYLHLQYGRQGSLEPAEFAIIDQLKNHKKTLEIPEVQFIPTGEDEF